MPSLRGEEALTPKVSDVIGTRYRRERIQKRPLPPVDTALNPTVIGKWVSRGLSKDQITELALQRHNERLCSEMTAKMDHLMFADYQLYLLVVDAASNGQLGSLEEAYKKLVGKRYDSKSA